MFNLLRLNIFSFLLFLFASYHADAGTFNFELSAMPAYVTFANLTNNSKVNLLRLGGSAYVGYRFGFLGVGNYFDYFVQSQLTTYDANVGNQRGTQMNLFTPTVSMYFNYVQLRFSYYLNSKYELSNPTIAGDSVTYTNPMAYRIQMIFGGNLINKKFKVAPKNMIGFGLYYESQTYSTAQEGNMAVNFSPSISSTAFGAMLVWQFQ
jgi:hypothetical protein